LNRDYYAPEQRFGDTTAVNQRADIYALGCIFYELLTSIPPVRTGAPPSSIVSIFAPFDAIWTRMTAWTPEDRYEAVEYACEDIARALGHVLAVLEGAPGVRHPDLKQMTLLIRSSNQATRQQGIDLAARLGKAAVAELHLLAGHGKREVRNSAALALGQVADGSSLPSLVAGMYGSTEKVGQFRPATDTAAEAIANFSVEERIRAITMIEQPIRPSQIMRIVKGLPKDIAYDAVVKLKQQKRLLLDYGETELTLLTQIDEERAWPGVLTLLSSRNDSQIKNTLQELSPARRCEMLREWIEGGPAWDFYFSEQIKMVELLAVDTDVKKQLLRSIGSNLGHRAIKWEDRVRIDRQLREARVKIGFSDEEFDAGLEEMPGTGSPGNSNSTE
jgi:hypothetical protein